MFNKVLMFNLKKEGEKKEKTKKEKNLYQSATLPHLLDNYDYFSALSKSKIRNLEFRNLRENV